MSWSVYNASGIPIGTNSITGVATILNVRDYGAKGDGSTDDRAAIQSAINAAVAAGVSGRGVDLYFPSGVYAYSGVLTVVGNNVRLVGSGWQSTVLYGTFTTGDMIHLGNGSGHSGLSITDMSLWCSAARTTGSTVNVDFASDTVLNRLVYNNYFTGVTVQGASLKVWITCCEFNNGHPADGIGINVVNGAGGDTYIYDSIWSNPPASKPLAGIQIVQTGHTSIARCNVTSCVYGLYVVPGNTQDVSYLFIDDTLFDSCSSAGAYFYASNATAARIRSVECVNSWFSGSTAGPGILFNTAGGTSVLDGVEFVGCRILNNNQNGVTLTAGNNIDFSDCMVCGNGQASSNTLDGIAIAANVNNVNVTDCTIGQAGTATNTQRYAINVAAGTSGGLVFTDNDCNTNGTLGNWGYINVGAITGGGNVIENNSPCVPKCFGSSALTASGAINTSNTIISDTTAQRNRLPASALRVGTTLRFVASGTCTASVANASTFRVYMGTLNTTSDTAVLTAAVTSAASGTTIPFRVTIEMTCRGPLGGTCAWYGYMTVENVGTTGLYTNMVFIIAGTMLTVASTSALYINLAYQSAAATTTSTFQIVTMEVVNP